MADIASGNVTYTEVAGAKRLQGMPPRFTNLVTLAFGNNTLTYPTGGIPLLKASLGCANSLDELEVLDQGANAKGYKFEWDKANNKLLVLIEATVGTNTPLAQHTNATFVPNPATLLVKVIGS